MLKGELFNQEMVQAYLEKRKLHTCRPLPKDAEVHECTDGIMVTRPKKYPGEYCRFAPLEPKFHPGDYMYVRETWTCMRDIKTGRCDYFYAANKKDYDTVSTTYLCDGDGFETDKPFPWKPSIHMPKAIARLFFQVTKVEVMRLEDVTEQFAQEDGFQNDPHCTAKAKFIGFWMDTYGEDVRWMWVYWTEQCSREEAQSDGRA